MKKVNTDYILKQMEAGRMKQDAIKLKYLGSFSAEDEMYITLEFTEKYISPYYTDPVQEKIVIDFQIHSNFRGYYISMAGVNIYLYE